MGTDDVSYQRLWNRTPSRMSAARKIDSPIRVRGSRYAHHTETVPATGGRARGGTGEARR